MTEPSHAVFLSYASQDAAAAQRICEALRAAGIEVWFDQSALRGGDVWDQAIRKQIKTCVLFIPVISRHTHEREEGYFRLEWKLAVDRSQLMTTNKAFLLPVVVDDTREDDENVPDRFKDIHWTRLPAGEASPAFVERVRRLVSQEPSPTTVKASLSANTAAAAAMTIADPIRSFWRPKKALTLAAAVIFSGLVAYFVIDKLWISKRQTSPAVPTSTAPADFVPPPHSVAVLPFVDMSGKRDQEYFSDGLSEELIDMLTKIPNLRVPARTSSFYFKGRQVTVADIAKVLNVAHVLEGSVRKSGNRLRITAQLIRVDNGYHLWSVTYDRELDDIFKVQDEIAGAVVRSLKISLLSSAPESPTNPNSEAYAIYLQSRYFADRSWDPENERKAADLLQQAVRLDPGFARAWAALASRHAFEATTGTRPPNEGREMALREADRAAALDPTLAETHMVKARISYYLDWDWPAAAAEINEARARDSYNADALEAQALVADTLGHDTEALRLRQQAIELDPLSPTKYFALGRTYIKLGRPADAEASFRKALDLNPAGPFLHWNIALALLLRGEYAAALAEMQREPAASGRTTGLALVYHAMAREADSDEALRAMPKADVSPFWFAAVHAFRGETDQALAWLDRAYQVHDFYLVDMKGFPLLKNLETDSRYKAFLRKMKLPD